MVWCDHVRWWRVRYAAMGRGWKGCDLGMMPAMRALTLTRLSPCALLVLSLCLACLCLALACLPAHSSASVAAGAGGGAQNAGGGSAAPDAGGFQAMIMFSFCFRLCLPTRGLSSRGCSVHVLPAGLDTEGCVPCFSPPPPRLPHTSIPSGPQTTTYTPPLSPPPTPLSSPQAA